MSKFIEYDGPSKRWVERSNSVDSITILSDPYASINSSPSPVPLPSPLPILNDIFAGSSSTITETESNINIPHKRPFMSAPNPTIKKVSR